MMDTRKKKILIISGLAFVFLILPLVLVAIFGTSSQTGTGRGITTSTDPISGDQIIDGDTTPETGDTTAQPLVYGIDNIADLYGNNDTFEGLRNNILNVQFPKAKIIKISQKDITKHIVTAGESDQPYIEVDFNVYLDTDTKNAYRVETKFFTDPEEIAGTVTDPKGVKTDYPSASIYGHD